MSGDAPTDPAALDYRSLGFVDNPFVPAAGEGDAADPQWVRQVTHSASCQLASAVDAVANQDRPSPIWLSTPMEVPDYYHRRAQNEFLALTGVDDSLGLLALNIPMEMMRLGRVRGSLAEVAELVAAVDLETTLAAYALAVLRDPDTSLAEYEAIADVDLEAVTARLESSPAEASGELFGESAYSRYDGVTDPDDVLHEIHLRQIDQERDPSESDDSLEEDAVAGDASLPEGQPSADDEGDAAEETTGEEDVVEGTTESDLIADYVIAHCRAHLSPVIARAIRAYKSDGAGAAAQELKVTRAPKKTLAALMRLACHRWRKLVLIYDRFDAWPMMEDEARGKVVGAMSELRWAAVTDGVFVLMVGEGLAPELEEQFAAAERLSWEMRGLIQLQNGETRLDLELVQEWLDAATLGGGASTIKVDGLELAPLVEASGDDILSLCAMAEAAIRSAAQRSVGELDQLAVEAGLAARL